MQCKSTGCKNNSDFDKPHRLVMKPLNNLKFRCLNEKCDQVCTYEELFTHCQSCTNK
jgi:hypothetical protein